MPSTKPNTRQVKVKGFNSNRNDPVSSIWINEKGCITDLIFGNTKHDSSAELIQIGKSISSFLILSQDEIHLLYQTAKNYPNQFFESTHKSIPNLEGKQFLFMNEYAWDRSKNEVLIKLRSIHFKSITLKNVLNSEKLAHLVENQTRMSGWMIDLISGKIKWTLKAKNNIVFNKTILPDSLEDLLWKVNQSDKFGLFRKYITLSKMGYPASAELKLKLIDINFHVSIHFWKNGVHLQGTIKLLSTDIITTEPAFSLFNHSNELLSFHSENGFFIECSQSFSKLLGYSPASLAGTHPQALIHPSDYSAVSRIWKANLMNRVQSSPIQFRILNAQGKFLWIESNLTPITNHIGRLMYVICSSRDITTLKEQVFGLQQENLKLRQANQTLEQFAHIASHDLQEPLRMITNFSKIIEQKTNHLADTELEMCLKHVIGSSKKLQRMVQDLLEYSTISQEQPKFYKNDLNDCLSDAIANLKTLIETNSAIISIEKNLPTLNCSAVLITCVFQNLIENAIKYKSDKAPKIQISFTERDRYHEFSIKDNGIGISYEFFEKIFMIFQRLHSSSQQTGSGLGLSICSKIISHHHGNMWVDSHINSGSTFYFTISKELLTD